VEQERVSTSNWNICVLWQRRYFIPRRNSCMLHVFRYTHYIWVNNNQVNESLSTFFLWKRVTVHWFLKLFIPFWCLGFM
jgi:hypothetical protein